jgi:hypothetical protein
VRIVIEPSMVQPDAVRPASGNYSAMFDEQAATAPATTWSNQSWIASDYPMGFYVDLGREYDLTQLGVFDTYSTDAIGFDIGAPGSWTNVVTAQSDLWQQWKLFTVTARTRYVRFTRGMYAGVNELALYGAPSGTPPPNQPPTVSAGSSQTITQPASSTTLSGTAGDVDGVIASQQWTQVSGPSNATLTNAASLTATATGLVVGIYSFRLTVTDDDGASASATTSVVVNPAPSGRGTTEVVYSSSSTPGNYGYVVYRPAGYDSGASWPIVFFLHGRDERGNGGPTELPRVRVNGPQRYIDTEGKDYPFLLVSPQASAISTWSDWEMQYMLDPFIEHILSRYRVDRRRVYLTGLSLGGSGTVSYASIFPSKLAAMLPVCPGSWAANLTDASEMVAAGLAIWAAHARNDGTIPYTATSSWFNVLGQAMGGSGGVLDTYTSPNAWQTAFFRPATGRWEWINGQTATDSTGAGPARPVLFTLYHDGNHGIWDRVYRDPRVWDWLLSQQRP